VHLFGFIIRNLSRCTDTWRSNHDGSSVTWFSFSNHASSRFWRNYITV